MPEVPYSLPRFFSGYDIKCLFANRCGFEFFTIVNFATENELEPNLSNNLLSIKELMHGFRLKMLF